MSVAHLAAKAHLSERAVQAAANELGRLGLMSATRVKGGSAYRLAMVDHVTEAADSAPIPGRVQNLHPADSAPLPASIHRPETAPAKAKPQASATRGAESAPPGPVDNFSDVLDLGSVVSGRKSRSKDTSETPREDVERLCRHLADRIEANGSKRPAIGKRWRDAARLLIDKDGRTEAQVMTAIDWCQQDEFWHRNILSMPKLREHYDRLRLAWQAERRKKSQPGRQQETDDQFKRAMERIKARKGNANGTGGDGHDSPVRQVALPPAGD